MNGKKFFIGGILCALIACVASATFLYQKNIQTKNEPQSTDIPREIKEKVQSTTGNATVKPVQQELNKTQRINMYDSEETRTLPFGAITQLATLSLNAQKTIENIMQNANVYYIDKTDDKIIVIKDANDEEARFTRHDVEIISISLDGTKIKKETNFPHKMSNEESEKEIWDYQLIEGDVMVPTSHKTLNENESIKFIEHWYYTPDEPVKYKLTNGNDKVLSIRKSLHQGGGNWSDEHIFYDENGNTALNITIAYENNNIARFTYYNPKKPEESVTILNEYINDEKSKETVYTTDYRLKNTFYADYKNGKRATLRVFDSNNHQINEFLAK